MKSAPLLIVGLLWSHPALAQSECAVTVVRENAPYSAQHLKFLAGFNQKDLTENEPRDEVRCVMNCGGSTLRFCTGETTTVNRELQETVLPPLLNCSLKAAAIKAAAVTATVSIEQFRNVARSRSVSLHSLGKAVDVFKIQVGADLHDYEQDWKAYLAHKRAADVPAFWITLEQCLNENDVYTITAGIGRTEITALQSKLSESFTTLRHDLATVGAELDASVVETKSRAVIAQMKTSDLELDPEEYDKKVIPLFQRAFALSARTIESLTELFAGSLADLHNALSEIEYYDRKGRDHFNHIHMSVPTTLDGFAAGPPPGGKRTRVRTWERLFESY